MVIAKRGRMAPKATSAAVVAFLCMCVSAAQVAVVAGAGSADVPANHRFQMYDQVRLVANKVGPYSNPTETYRYYSLPFCPHKTPEHQSHELGELLAGDRKVSTPYDIRFRVREEWRMLCEKTLTAEELEQFAVAAEEDYYFEMFLDDLPIWGYVGDSEEEDLVLGHTANSKHYLYTHLHFSIAYNGESIVAVNVSTDPSKKLDITKDPPLNVRFSYSVDWVPSTVSFADRMNRYTQVHFLPATLEIHWLSIINILVLVLLLTAFLAVILMRVVKNDFTRYMRADDDDDGLGGEEETGWKLIHADVFRFPSHLNFFCAAVGAGAQLFSMTLCLLSMAVLGVFAPSKRGSIVTACIVLYTLCAGVGGFVSARLYRQLQGDQWAWNIVLCAVLLPGPLLAIFSFLNTTAIAHGSTAALPFSTIMIVLALFALVNLPLTVLGGVAGRNVASDFNAPCRTTKMPRQIPQVPCYRSSFSQFLVAGFLPFSAISIELHYIFASVWGHKVYTLFGILFLAFVLCTVVTSFIVIALTYFQLAVEDHRWWWRSFISGGAVGVFVYAYCFFYYFTHSEMSGFLQTSFFFGYMAIVSIAFFLMLGFVGFFSALGFVRYIYGRIKIE